MHREMSPSPPNPYKSLVVLLISRWLGALTGPPPLLLIPSQSPSGAKGSFVSQIWPDCMTKSAKSRVDTVCFQYDERRNSGFVALRILKRAGAGTVLRVSSVRAEDFPLASPSAKPPYPVISTGAPRGGCPIQRSLARSGETPRMLTFHLQPQGVLPRQPAATPKAGGLLATGPSLDHDPWNKPRGELPGSPWPGTVPRDFSTARS